MSHVLYRNLARTYPLITRGEGVYLFDDCGRRYLDASSGALAANLGHGRRDVAAAMARQAERVAFAHTMRFTNEPLEALADAIDRLVGGPGHWYTYPVSGGSEAVETAVKLARHIQRARGEGRRYRVLALRPSYHGNSLGALAASGDPDRQEPYEPLLSPAFVHAPGPRADCRASGLAADPCGCLRGVIQAAEGAGTSSLAAVILEPISGSTRSGFVPHPGFVAGLVAWAHRHGLLVIGDEVMTGFGRTGRVLGFDHHGVRPDMLAAAKGLSGGYAPVGAVVVSEGIYRELGAAPSPFAHGFTYSGHPVACAAAAEALAIVEREDLVDRAADMGNRLAAGLIAIGRRHPAVIQTVRGRGLMQGLLLQNQPGLAAAVVERSSQAGLLLYQGHGTAEGGDGQHLLVGPPLTVSAAEIDEILAGVEQAVAGVESPA